MTEIDDLTVDTTQAQRQLEELRQTSDLTAMAVMRNVRKGYESMILLSDLFNVMIPFYFQLLAQGAFMAGEMFVELGTAEAATGYLAAKSVITFSMAALLFYRAAVLKSTGEEAGDKINTLIQLGRTWFP